MSISVRMATLRWLVPAALLLVGGLIVLVASAFTVDAAEQVVITQFGKPIGQAIQDPGLHFKLPFIQEVRRFDRRILAWDGEAAQINTLGREFISVDTTARWKIVDPLRYLQSVRDESGAQSRLDDVIESVVRDMISKTELVEIVRGRDWHVDERRLRRTGISDKERQILQRKIEVGREQLEADIRDAAGRNMAAEFGIELVDVRIQRLNYVVSVQKEVFNRMISERQRIAEQFRSEGAGQSSAILGETEKEVAMITSEAQRQAEVIRGQADAEATRIYNEAYSLDPEFFAFYRTLESYRTSIGKETTLLIGTDSDYFQYLRRTDPEPRADNAAGSMNPQPHAAARGQ